ncbi:MAG: DNA polymerase III subunit gamma/tau [bacterium]|nr:DNA polymerase III subunit gamma/tau [bacterium]
MSYTSLYRKFRPIGFEDVKGQEHIVKTLQNQITSGRVGHAYLFCGTRGTGKTTIAKILARAVNCEHPIDGSPCNECAVCKSILNNTSMNVIEIDAASNNGVDNIRDIIDEVQYSPTEGKYKVYIIDEVHMLSAGAFNALLKTLEEPPSYVIFILATTEVHKIPITILSRCQRYDFRRISIDTIADRMADLMVEEKVEVEPKALRYVAKAADGSMRDGLSLLDQCIAFNYGEVLTYDKVLEVLGAVDIEVFQKLMTYIRTQDVVNCMELIEELLIKGRELSQFVIDFTWYLRNLMLLKTSEHAEDMIEVSTENYEQLKQMANEVELDTLMRYIRIFSDLANQIKYASQKRVLVEIACIKLCRPEMETNYDSVLDRLRVLEDKLENGVVVSGRQESGTVQSMAAAEDVPAKPQILVEALPEEVQSIAKNWNRILDILEGPIRSMLMSAKPTVNEANEIVLVFSKDLDRTYVEREDSMAILKQAIGEYSGKEVKIQTKVVAEGREGFDKISDISKLIKTPNVEYD